MNSRQLTAAHQKRLRQALEKVPFAKLLGLELESFEPGTAILALTIRAELRQNNDVVHGGAIASLIDTAAMVAAWADDSVPENMRGTTVSLSVTYLAPAEHEDIQATAQVLRRGRSLVYLDVEVQSVSGKSIARGLITYKLG